MTSGVLGSDISRAVEIIAATGDVPGRSAFAFLAQAAKDSRLSVGDFASVFVEKHGELDREGA